MKEKSIAPRGEVLVAIINNYLDFAILNEQNWYRIPVKSVEKWLSDRWPPKILAFYQTRIFNDEAYQISYFANVKKIRIVKRSDLFPDEPKDDRSEKQYYKLELSPLLKLSQPIVSKRRRRIVFIPTTIHNLESSSEINDLYCESFLEEVLWEEFKKFNIPAERQEYIISSRNNYFLDFAIYCATGKLDIETDGDRWHSEKKQIANDNRRDNDLLTLGWNVLRFNSQQILETTSSYCIETVVENINNFGGVEESKVVPKKISLDTDSYQPSIFD